MAHLRDFSATLLLVLASMFILGQATTFEYTMLTTDANVAVRLYDYYSSSAVSTFYFNSIPDPSTQGNIVQTTTGTSPDGATISAAGNPGGIITDPTGSGTVFFLPFTSPAPEMRVSLQVIGLNSTNDIVTDDTIVIYVYTACPAIPDLSPSWGVNNVNPPAPTHVSIAYNTATNLFDVQVDTTYLRDDVAYLIDFSDFDPNGSDNIRNVQSGSGNCGTRVAMTPSNVDWSDVWTSAPDAQFSGALTDGTTYRAYAPVNSPLWSVAATSCSAISYTASFTFTELTSCQLRSSATPAVTVDQSTPNAIVYSGALYVNILRPVNITSESAGYQRTQFVYPFQFTFTKTFEAITGATSDQDFILEVLSTELTAGGGLQVDLRTVYNKSPSNSGLTTPTVVPLPDGINSIVVVPASGSPTCSATVNCEQTWTATFSPAWSAAYNGDYTFSWSDVDTPTTSVFGIITINQQATPASSTGTHTLPNSIGVYLTNSDWVAATNPLATPSAHSFVSGDTVYVRTDVTINSGDTQNFGLTITNAWVCYTDNANYQIQYTGTKLGCADSFILPSQKVQLIANGGLVSTGAASKFATFVASNSAFTVTDTVAVGIHFLAQPIAFQTKQYAVHLEVVLSQNAGGKRSVSTQHLLFGGAAIKGTQGDSDTTDPWRVGDGLAQIVIKTEPEDHSAAAATTISLILVAIVIAVAMLW